MSLYEFLIWYYSFLLFTVGISFVFIFILFRRVKYQQPIASIVKCIKINIWILYLLYGVNMVNINLKSVLYIVPSFILVYVYGCYSIRVERITNKYYIFSLISSLAILTLHTLLIIQKDNIYSSSDAMNHLTISMLFFLQSGASVIIISGIYIYGYNKFSPVEKDFELEEIVIKQDTVIEENDCPICLDSLEKVDLKVVKTSCNHIFHKDCIDVHLDNSDKCPMCRNNLRTHHCFI